MIIYKQKISNTPSIFLENSGPLHPGDKGSSGASSLLP